MQAPCGQAAMAGERKGAQATVGQAALPFPSAHWEREQLQGAGRKSQSSPERCCRKSCTAAMVKC